MKYLLDANVFIEAKNRYYGFDLCPGFWTWIDEAYAADRAQSVEKIGEELQDGSDELATWAKARPELFAAPDEAVVDGLRELATWAEGASYTDAAVAEFLQRADSYLVAHAQAHNLTVVTQEVASDGLKKVKIPNACRHAGVEYCTPFAMLRAEGALFVLDGH